MASGLDVQTDPVFWWWEEDGASRVVLLTDALLILSGPLTDAALAELEEARRAGTVEAADFGSDAHRVSVGAIERLRYVPDAHRLEIDLVGAGQFDVEPPRSNAGVALGVFDTLAKRLAPGREPVDSHTDRPAEADDQALTIVGAMVVLGLVSLGLAVAAGQGEPTGPLAGIRTTLNDVFDRAGYVPALLLFAVAAIVQIYRMRDEDTETDEQAPVGPRVLELDLSGEQVVEMPAAAEADPPADAPTPAEHADEATADTDDPPETSAAAWAPPETTGAWEDAVASQSAPSTEPTDVDADESATGEPADDGWQPPSIEESVEPPTVAATDEVAGEPWSSDEPTEPADAAGESWAAAEDAGESWSSEESADAAGGSWAAAGAAEPQGWSSDEPAEVAGESWSSPEDAGESWSSDEPAEPGGWWADEPADVEPTPIEGVAADQGETVSAETDLKPEVDDVEPDAVASGAEYAEAVTATDAPGDVEAEFWSQSASDAPDEPWWERAEAADAGDPGTLPPPPASPFAEPEVHDADMGSLDEPAAPAAEVDDVVEPAAPAAEVDDVVEPVAPVVQAEDEVEPAAPVAEETTEVPVPDHPQVAWSEAPAVVAADESTADVSHTAPEPFMPEPTFPAPDSPFAEILDREAPLPAWASAPEPTDQLVDRSAMERSVPATLLPETADRD